MEFSLKAIGIAAFSATAFGTTLPFILENQIDPCARLLFYSIAGAMGVVIISLLFVVIPGKWKRPFDIEKVRSDLTKFEAHDTESEIHNIEVGLGKAYAEAIQSNWKNLDPKANWMKCQIFFVSVQAILSVLLFVYMLSP